MPSSSPSQQVPVAVLHPALIHSVRAGAVAVDAKPALLLSVQRHGYVEKSWRSVSVQRTQPQPRSPRSSSASRPNIQARSNASRRYIAVLASIISGVKNSSAHRHRVFAGEVMYVFADRYVPASSILQRIRMHAHCPGRLSRY